MKHIKCTKQPLLMIKYQQVKYEEGVLPENQLKRYQSRNPMWLRSKFDYDVIDHYNSRNDENVEVKDRIGILTEKKFYSYNSKEMLLDPQNVCTDISQNKDFINLTQHEIYLDDLELNNALNVYDLTQYHIVSFIGRSVILQEYSTSSGLRRGTPKFCFFENIHQASLFVQIYQKLQQPCLSAWKLSNDTLAICEQLDIDYKVHERMAKKGLTNFQEVKEEILKAYTNRLWRQHLQKYGVHIDMIYEFVIHEVDPNLDQEIKSEKSDILFRSMLRKAIGKWRSDQRNDQYQRTYEIIQLVTKYIDVVVKKAEFNKRRVVQNSDEAVIDIDDIEVEDAWNMVISKIKSEDDTTDSEKSDRQPSPKIVKKSMVSQLFECSPSNPEKDLKLTKDQMESYLVQQNINMLQQLVQQSNDPIVKQNSVLIAQKLQEMSKEQSASEYTFGNNGDDFYSYIVNDIEPHAKLRFQEFDGEIESLIDHEEAAPIPYPNVVPEVQGDSSDDELNESPIPREIFSPFRNSPPEPFSEFIYNYEDNEMKSLFVENFKINSTIPRLVAKKLSPEPAPVKKSYIFKDDLTPPKSMRTQDQYEGGSSSIKLLKCPDSAIRTPFEQETPVVHATFGAPEQENKVSDEDLDFHLEVYDKYEANRIKCEEELEKRILSTINETQSEMIKTNEKVGKKVSFAPKEEDIDATIKKSKLESYFSKKSKQKSRQITQNDLSPVKNRKRI